MARCKCGNSLFYGHQVCRRDIVVDADGNWHGSKYPFACYDAGTPYGPFTCTQCGASYERLPDDLPCQS